MLLYFKMSSSFLWNCNGHVCPDITQVLQEVPRIDADQTPNRNFPSLIIPSWCWIRTRNRLHQLYISLKGILTSRTSILLSVDACQLHQWLWSVESVTQCHCCVTLSAAPKHLLNKHYQHTNNQHTNWKALITAHNIVVFRFISFPHI